MTRAAMRILAAVLVLCSLQPALARHAAAQEWGPATAEYSARLTFTDGRGEVLIHRLYHTEKRQRVDYKSGEADEIAIVDQVAAAVFILYPARKRYIKSALVQPEFDLGIGRADTKREKVAEEAVAGLAATKYRVEAKTAQGQEFKGFAWLTAERIVVKLEGEVKQGRRTRRLTMTASEIKIGAMEAALFAVPAGYTLLEDKRK